MTFRYRQYCTQVIISLVYVQNILRSSRHPTTSWRIREVLDVSVQPLGITNVQRTHAHDQLLELGIDLGLCSGVEDVPDEIVIVVMDVDMGVDGGAKGGDFFILWAAVSRCDHNVDLIQRPRVAVLVIGDIDDEANVPNTPVAGSCGVRCA